MRVISKRQSTGEGPTSNSQRFHHYLLNSARKQLLYEHHSQVLTYIEKEYIKGQMLKLGISGRGVLSGWKFWSCMANILANETMCDIYRKSISADQWNHVSFLAEHIYKQLREDCCSSF